MTDEDRIPDHLADGPQIEEADFVLSGFTNDDTTAIHAAITNISLRLSESRDTNSIRYFVLGNYDDGRKKWLKEASRLLEYFNSTSIAVLLSDLDPDNDDWENFYIKFRYTLSFIDYSILVAEDNDGGHELELGEVPLASTYVVKRDYESVSIDHDLEYEKYDAMMAKLFDVMARQNHLFSWDSKHSFARSVQAVASTTATRELRAANDADELEPSKYEQATIPDSWQVTEDFTDPPEDPDTIAGSLVYYEKAEPDVNVKVQPSFYDDSTYSLDVDIKTDGRIRNVPVEVGESPVELRSKARYVVATFQRQYDQTKDGQDAIEHARTRVERIGSS